MIYVEMSWNFASFVRSGPPAGSNRCVSKDLTLTRKVQTQNILLTPQCLYRKLLMKVQSSATARVPSWTAERLSAILFVRWRTIAIWCTHSSREARNRTYLRDNATRINNGLSAAGIRRQKRVTGYVNDGSSNSEPAISRPISSVHLRSSSLNHRDVPVLGEIFPTERTSSYYSRPPLISVSEDIEAEVLVEIDSSCRSSPFSTGTEAQRQATHKVRRPGNLVAGDRRALQSSSHRQGEERQIYSRL